MREGEKWDCSTCMERDKVARGCRGTRRWVIGTQVHYGCPGKLLEASWVREGIRLWSRWKKYGWPFVGGWAEQPARVFDVVDAVENESIAIDNAKVERANSKR